jgi:poly-gamma-glutamate capsule biosynthesis protein CapA/YwtB (metallophosphatase superfamily)
MGKRTKPIIASLLIIAITTALWIAAALLRHPGRWVPDRMAPARPTVNRRAIVPPSKAAEAKSATRILSIPNRAARARKAVRCLNALGDTGASEDALAETRGLVAQLDAAPEPFARGLSAQLKSILSYHAGPSTGPLPGFPGLPRDLLDRAAAACDARGRRRPDEIVLSFAGDCTFGTVNGDDSAIRFPSVYRRSGRLDYPFALVRPWFLNDDLTVVNFECTLTDAARTADKQWKFKGAARYAALFPAGSVEAAGLSNNHAFDYLQTGFNDTVTNFRKAHVPVFYQNVPYITTLQGVETVLIGDCTVVGENTTLIDGAPGRVINEIKRYKKPDNIVIVVMHWGSELDTVPRPWQQAMGRKFIDAGADAVVGHHPHVVQGIERYKGKYIAYSLGNFAFGGNSLARYPETFVLRLRFHAGRRKTSASDASIVPCWVTSSQTKNEANILRNNYQPKPVFGETADRTVSLVLERSARLAYGVKGIAYLRLR